MASTSPGTGRNAEFEIKDSFLAPWGLSTEELPMHLLWSGTIEEVSIMLPSELEVVEIYNVEGISTEELTDSSEIQLSETDLITSGYLGLVLMDKNKYSDPVFAHNIEVIFSNEDGEQATLQKRTNIIRPEIRVQNAPDKIRLTDDNIPDCINIDMEYIGFGMAQVAVEAEAEGEFVSEGESLLHDLLEAILETEVHKQDVDSSGEIPEEWEDESGIELPQEEIEELVKEMSRLARSEELTEKYDSQELMEVADALKEAEEMSQTNSDVAAVIYRFIETALLSSILNVVDRHPTENVSLDNPTTKIRTKARTTELEVKIRLSDGLENEYEPETVLIEIQDDREREAGHLETEITTNWENYQVNPDEVFGDE
jgi:hypothetical protein